jgi:Fic family protein
MEMSKLKKILIYLISFITICFILPAIFTNRTARTSANDILDEDFIKNTHKILKTNTSDSRISWFNVGEYKSRKNMVGDLITTPPEKVKSTIEKLLNEYNKKQTVSFDDILDFHVKFERIHPFQDGNGRVGRLLCSKNV